MARNNTASLEAKALAADTKSEGMRMLYENGMTVAQVSKVFGVGYAFAYGVAKRAGVVNTAAERRAPAKAKVAAPKAAPAKKATATTKSAAEKVAAKVKATTAAAKAATPKVSSRTTAKTAPAVKVTKIAGEELTPGQKAYRARKARNGAVAEALVAKPKAAPVKAGRPSAARREANRAPRESKVAQVAAKLAARNA